MKEWRIACVSLSNFGGESTVRFHRWDRTGESNIRVYNRLNLRLKRLVAILSHRVVMHEAHCHPGLNGWICAISRSRPHD